jgi:hypothetical protein
MQHNLSNSNTDQILPIHYFNKCMLLQKNFLQNLHYNRYNVLSHIFKIFFKGLD